MISIEQYLTTPQRLYEVHEDTKRLAKLETYLNGIRHGIFITWNSNGDIKSEMRYVNGSLHGFQKFYRHNFLIKYSEYRYGHRSGRCWELGDDGSHRYDQFYMDEILEGEHITNKPDFQFISPGVSFFERD